MNIFENILIKHISFVWYLLKIDVKNHCVKFLITNSSLHIEHLPSLRSNSSQHLQHIGCPNAGMTML